MNVERSELRKAAIFMRGIGEALSQKPSREIMKAIHDTPEEAEITGTIIELQNEAGGGSGGSGSGGIDGMDIGDMGPN